MAYKLEKRYLGDGLYADYDGFQIVLTAENGIEATDRVCLEPEVLSAFEVYVADLRKSFTPEIQETGETQ